MATSMTYSQHLRAVLALGLPLIGSQVAQFAITLTDTIMLGWYDLTVLAGQVLGGTLFFVLFLMGSGFAFAVMPLVASAESAGNRPQVRRITRMGLWISAIYGLAAIPVLVWSEPILLLLGQDPELAAIAQHYSRLMALSLLPALGVMVLKNYLSALELTKIVLWVTLLALPLNALVNYLLIFGNWGAPELGVRGAAIASACVHLVSVVLLIIYSVWRLPEHALFGRLWKVDGEALGQVFRLGWPIGLTLLAEVGLFAASSLMMGWLGKVPLAAHGIALQVSSLTFMFHIGLSSAATVRAGRALGRSDYAGLRRGGLVAIAVSLVFVALTVVVFLTLPAPIISLFIDPDDPLRSQVLALGVVLLAAAAIFQLADASQVMALGLLRGVQDTRVPMIIAAISYWVVGAPISYYMGFQLGWGGVGVWIGLAVGLGVAAVMLMWRFWSRVPKADA